MKIFRSIVWITALMLLACTKQGADDPGALVLQTINASAGEAVKTVVSGSSVLWSPNEKVNVFVEDASYTFTSNKSTESSSTTFNGYAPADMYDYVMLSPYNSQAVCGVGSITTTLPSVQEGKAGSFAPGTAIMAGQSSTKNVVCRHVCSGIRFQVTGSEISSVTLKGRGGEKISGQFSFQFTAGVPKVTSVVNASDEVTLTAPGGTFTPGQWYYIVCLPTEFDNGITLTLIRTDGKIGTYTVSGSIEFERGIFKEKTSLDGGVTWVTPSALNTYYGPANTICLRPGGSAQIDVTPKLILSGWQRSNIVSGTPAASRFYLWDTGAVTATLSASTLTLTAGASAGAELVALKDGSGNILWSFLVWVTASEPSTITLPTGAILQETLGGELYFQWGRKDPLVAGGLVINHPGDAVALSTSIQNPVSYINAGTNCYDWYAAESYDHQDATLWGGASGSKTVWDPCPAGWRVPNVADLGVASLAESYAGSFEKLGILLPKDGVTAPNIDYGWDSYCWTREGEGNKANSLRMTTDGYVGFGGFEIEGNTRYLGLSVRCVKED